MVGSIDRKDPCSQPRRSSFGKRRLLLSARGSDAGLSRQTMYRGRMDPARRMLLARFEDPRRIAGHWRVLGSPQAKSITCHLARMPSERLVQRKLNQCAPRPGVGRWQTAGQQRTLRAHPLTCAKVLRHRRTKQREQTRSFGGVSTCVSLHPMPKGNEVVSVGADLSDGPLRRDLQQPEVQRSGRRKRPSPQH